MMGKNPSKAWTRKSSLVCLEYLPGVNMVADPLTKPLSQEVFGKHVKAMGLRIF